MQQAQVRSEDVVAYKVTRSATGGESTIDDDALIAAALAVLSARLKVGPLFNSPQSVKDYCRLKLGGLTADSLNGLLIDRFRDRIVNTPVDVRLVRPVPVFGSVRSPGVYPVDPTSTAIQVIARAGGTVGAEGLPRVQLLRFDGTRLDLTVEQSLGAFNLRSGDAIFVQDQSFWIRNQRQITTIAAVSTIIASVISIAVLLGN